MEACPFVESLSMKTKVSEACDAHETRPYAKNKTARPGTSNNLQPTDACDAAENVAPPGPEGAGVPEENGEAPADATEAVANPVVRVL